MKGPINGAINLSILDGWWVECYANDQQSGWAIGNEQEHPNDEYQDHIDSESLFELIEKEVIPEFYDRGADNLPRKWTARMKHSIRACCSVFNTSRMVQQYAETSYMPASDLCIKLLNEHGQGAKSLAKWKEKVAGDWDKVWIFDVKANNDGPMKSGAMLEVEANVSLGPLNPDEVTIELYHGPLDSSGNIIQASRSTLTKISTQEKKSPEFPIHTYGGKVSPQRCGQQGFAVRALPKNPNVDIRMEPGLIRWS
jgi:starch phosphorylase